MQSPRTVRMFLAHRGEGYLRPVTVHAKFMVLQARSMRWLG